MSTPKSDRADCTVRALAVVTGLAYEQAFAIAAAAGRKPGRGMRSEHLIKLVQKTTEQGFTFRKVRGKARSIYRFTQEHPAGRFYCRRRGHAFAVVDGVAVNEHQGDRTMVLDAWELIDTKPASAMDRLLQLCPISMMDAACELDVSYRQIQGLAMNLVRNGSARWFRGRLVAIDRATA